MMGFDGLSSIGESIWIGGVPCPVQGVNPIEIPLGTVNPVGTYNPVGFALLGSQYG